MHPAVLTNQPAELNENKTDIVLKHKSEKGKEITNKRAIMEVNMSRMT
jgi:hypothetical protein